MMAIMMVKMMTIIMVMMMTMIMITSMIMNVEFFLRISLKAMQIKVFSATTYI